MSSCPSSEGSEWPLQPSNSRSLKQGSTGFLVANCFAWSSLKSVAEVHGTGQHRAAQGCTGLYGTSVTTFICLYWILFPHCLTVQKSHEITARWFMVVQYVSCVTKRSSALASAFASAFSFLGTWKDQILSGRVPTVRATSETTAAQLKKNAEVTGTSLRVLLSLNSYVKTWPAWYSVARINRDFPLPDRLHPLANDTSPSSESLTSATLTALC